MIQKQIAYHEREINRLYEQRDRVQDNLHTTTGKDRHATADEILMYAKTLYQIEKDLRGSIEVRIALLKIQEELKN